MKKNISLILSILTIICLFQLNAFATDINKDANKAIVVQDGSTENITFRTDLYDDAYDQYRWYKITPQKSDIYRFHLENLYSSDSEFQVNLNIYDTTDEWNQDSEPGDYFSISGSTYLTEEDKCGETDIILKQGITYYIELFADGSYDFDVDIDLQMSVNVIDNQLYEGQRFTETFNRILDDYSYSRIYSFVPNNNLNYEKYDIVLSSSKLKSEDYVVISLEDENGNFIDYDIFGSNGDDIILTNSFKSGSKYYLIIDSSSPNRFDITINIVKHHTHNYKSVVTKPTPIKLGHTIYTCSICGHSYNIYTAPTGKPAGFKCTARTAAAMKFTWTKTSGVSGYQIQLLNSAGKSAGIKALTGNAYTFSKLAAGHAYKARVRFYIKAADGKNYFGAWSTISSPTLPKATNVSLTAAKKAFTAKWGKVAGVTGYQLQYATNAKFTKATTKTIKGAAKYSLKVANLKAGAKYFVRVRTYKTIGGKNYYSTWSGAKAVKTK